MSDRCRTTPGKVSDHAELGASTRQSHVEYVPLGLEESLGAGVQAGCCDDRENHDVTLITLKAVGRGGLKIVVSTQTLPERAIALELASDFLGLMGKGGHDAERAAVAAAHET